MAVLDISGHYAAFHNQETVTVTFKRAAGDTPATVQSAQRGRIFSRSEARRLGAALMTDSLSFFIPRDELIDDQAAETMEPGDTITDASASVYRVLSVSEIALGQHVSGYRCQVREHR